jgi:putative transposase
MEAFSLDLRQRVVQACADEVETREEIAETHGVSRSFVQKLLRRWRDSDSIAAKARGRGPSPSLGELQWVRKIRQIVRSDSDATLSELCVALVELGGPSVSRSTMCRTLTAMGLPLKKSRCTPASGTRLA